MAYYNSGEINKGDKFLICSDGISTGLTQDEIKKAMSKGEERGIQVLWKYVKKRKIRDNCSAVILNFENISKIKVSQIIGLYKMA